jgi:hypothetical protein
MLCHPISQDESGSSQILYQKSNAFGLRVNSELLAQPITNCVKHVQVSLSKILCGQCVTGAIKIFNSQDSSSFMFTNWNGSSNEFHARRLAVAECFLPGQESPDKYTFYVDKDQPLEEDPFAESHPCEMAIISEDSNIRCMTCSGQTSPVYGNGFLDITSTDFKFPIITNCKSTEMTKKFQGFGLGIESNPMISEIIQFDSCESDSQIVSLQSSWSNTNEIQISSEGIHWFSIK